MLEADAHDGRQVPQSGSQVETFGSDMATCTLVTSFCSEAMLKVACDARVRSMGKLTFTQRFLDVVEPE